MIRRSRRDPNEPPAWQPAGRHRAGATRDDLASLCRSGRLQDPRPARQHIMSPRRHHGQHPRFRPTSLNYRITPGTGYDGVVRVSTGTVYGTGTLLPGGRHVLTAAHVVDDAVPAGLKVFLDVPGSAPPCPPRR